jgi:hypothetical protein
MRIENHFGKNIVCGHIFPDNEVKVGSQWQSSSGSIVTVQQVDLTESGSEGWVTYNWMEQGHRRTHEKMIFAFQCRYCLIVEDEAQL